MMQLIFIYGPPAAGKYTVARRVCYRTGLALFHNHLVMDAVAAVFPFASPPFVRLREQFWMEVIRAAAAEDRSLIFTFQPEDSVEPGFAERVVEAVEAEGGEVVFVHLKLCEAGQRARIANRDRSKFGKLRDLDILEANLAQFAACEAAMPTPDLTIDTGETDPESAADQIHAFLEERQANSRASA